MELNWKKIYNNTYRAVDVDGTEHIKLHHTVIYSRTKDGIITLNSGGCCTHTTRKRMDTHLEGTPWRVCQGKFDMYVINIKDRTLRPFVDGMTLQG